MCSVGVAVFRRRARDSNKYVAEEPKVMTVKLPAGEQVAKKATDVHGNAKNSSSAHGALKIEVLLLGR